MDQNDQIEILNRVQKRALTIGVVAVVVCLVGFMTNRAQFYQSYLMSFLFWAGISAGSLAWLMIQHLVKSQWGYAVRRILEASTKTLPLTVLLFIPICFGMQELFHWAHTDATAHDEILQKKALYLNARFFIERAAVYFIIWIGLAALLSRLADRQDKTADASLNYPIRVVSGLGLLLYAMTATFASFDWQMSLEPHWFSSMSGPLFMVSQGLTTLAFTIVFMKMLSKSGPLEAAATPKAYHDIGNMTFAFVILWTYMTFGQFLIIWAGNLPEEITWYAQRSSTGWKLIAVFLTLFHFAIPFLILLSRHAKLKSPILVKVAIGLLLVRFVDLFWVTAPTFQNNAKVHWLDILVPVAMGGLWVALFSWRLKQRPLLPQHDPLFSEAEEEAHHA